MSLLSILKKKDNKGKEAVSADNIKSHVIGSDESDTKTDEASDRLKKAKEKITNKMAEIETQSKSTHETEKSVPEDNDENEPEKKENNTEDDNSADDKLRRAKERIMKKMAENSSSKTETEKEDKRETKQASKSIDTESKDSKAQKTTKKEKEQSEEKKDKSDDESEEPKDSEDEDTDKENLKKIALNALMKNVQKTLDIDIANSKEIEKYDLEADDVKATVIIYNVPNQYIPIYYLKRPTVTMGTYAILNAIRDQLILLVNITTKEFVDPSALNVVKKKFMSKAYLLLDKYLPNVSAEEKKTLAGNLIHEMLGLGEIELILADPYLEEIVVNGHNDPVWVYHKHHGWLKTNIFIDTEDKIYNFSSSIGRRVGREITNLEPLMDAHLSTGDRVNATLFPISTGGNTITIRKFSRSPWTIIHFLEANTLSKEVAAILWLAIQYELNIMVAGGTASGKTSMLNILMPFMPPNQRILSIEDTREINLPKFLHWVPFSSREANPEGKGEVSMLDLLANSLRMRPDRIIVGEIRRAKEAEVMFEAIRTGHSAYATFHGDKAEEVFKRLTNPPINLPTSSLSALHLVVVQYRHRRKGIRRTLEVAEIIKSEEGNAMNIIYQWNPRTDILEPVNRPYRLYKEIRLYTGMTNEEMEEDIQNKIKIFDWMTKYQIKTINTVGKVIAEYYRDEKRVVELAKKDISPQELLGEELYAEIDPDKKSQGDQG